MPIHQHDCPRLTTNVCDSTYIIIIIICIIMTYNFVTITAITVIFARKVDRKNEHVYGNGISADRSSLASMAYYIILLLYGDLGVAMWKPPFIGVCQKVAWAKYTVQYATHYLLLFIIGYCVDQEIEIKNNILILSSYSI